MNIFAVDWLITICNLVWRVRDYRVARWAFQVCKDKKGKNRNWFCPTRKLLIISNDHDGSRSLIRVCIKQNWTLEIVSQVWESGWMGQFMHESGSWNLCLYFFKNIPPNNFYLENKIQYRKWFRPLSDYQNGTSGFFGKNVLHF